MSSRSLAAARSRRAGENAPPVSGNRPITSIGSQAAFAQQMPPNMGYNMPPPPNNVRTNRAPQQPNGKANNKYYQQYYIDHVGFGLDNKLDQNKIINVTTFFIKIYNYSIIDLQSGQYLLLAYSFTYTINMS
jgi:hypothetical protein